MKKRPSIPRTQIVTMAVRSNKMAQNLKLSSYLNQQYYNLMQSYPARALARRLQVDWARDPRKGPRVLMSLRVDFEPMG